MPRAWRGKTQTNRREKYSSLILIHFIQCTHLPVVAAPAEKFGDGALFFFLLDDAAKVAVAGACCSVLLEFAQDCKLLRARNARQTKVEANLVQYFTETTTSWYRSCATGLDVAAAAGAAPVPLDAGLWVCCVQCCGCAVLTGVCGSRAAGWQVCARDPETTAGAARRRQRASDDKERPLRTCWHIGQPMTSMAIEATVAPD